MKVSFGRFHFFERLRCFFVVEALCGLPRGWVDAGDASTVSVKPIAKGGKVKVLKAVTYTGKSFKTCYDTYDVLQVNGDRVVIGVGKTVTAAVSKTNLQAV